MKKNADWREFLCLRCDKYWKCERSADKINFPQSAQKRKERLASACFSFADDEIAFASQAEFLSRALFWWENANDIINGGRESERMRSERGRRKSAKLPFPEIILLHKCSSYFIAIFARTRIVHNLYSALEKILWRSETLQTISDLFIFRMHFCNCRWVNGKSEWGLYGCFVCFIVLNYFSV